MAIQTTVAKGQNGAPNMIGYGVPMPTGSFRDCLPGPTPLVFDGTIDMPPGPSRGEGVVGCAEELFDLSGRVVFITGGSRGRPAP